VIQPRNGNFTSASYHTPHTPAGDGAHRPAHYLDWHSPTYFYVVSIAAAEIRLTSADGISIKDVADSPSDFAVKGIVKIERSPNDQSKSSRLFDFVENVIWQRHAQIARFLHKHKVDDFR
jgi:hypothetical protein